MLSRIAFGLWIGKTGVSLNASIAENEQASPEFFY